MDCDANAQNINYTCKICQSDVFTFQFNYPDAIDKHARLNSFV